MYNIYKEVKDKKKSREKIFYSLGLINEKKYNISEKVKDIIQINNLL